MIHLYTSNERVKLKSLKSKTPSQHIAQVFKFINSYESPKVICLCIPTRTVVSCVVVFVSIKFFQVNFDSLLYLY